MATVSVKNKILNYFDPLSGIDCGGSLVLNFTQSTALKPARSFAHSTASINRNPYINSEDDNLNVKSQSESGSVGKGKKKYINVVSSQKQSLMDLKSSSIKLSTNKRKNSILLDRKTERVKRWQNEQEDNSFKKSESLSLYVKINSNSSCGATQMMNKERLVQPNTPISLLQNNLGVEKENKHQPVAQVLKNAQSSRNIVLQQPFYELELKPEMKSQTQPLTVFYQERVNKSPPVSIGNSRMAQTPIRAYVPSPPSHPETPTRVLSKPNLSRQQQLKCNIQISNKLNTECSAQGYMVKDYMRLNPHQKAINMLSGERLVAVQGPLAYRVIQKRELPYRDVMQVGASASVCAYKKQSVICTPAKNQVNVFFISEQRTNKVSSFQLGGRYESQHRLDHSPNPLQQKSKAGHPKDKPAKEKQQGQSKQFQQIIDHPRKSPVLMKLKRPVTEQCSFFAEDSKLCQVSKGGNSLIKALSRQIQSINSQRIQRQSRISKRLEELSERACSMVKMYSEQSRRSPGSPAKQSTLMACRQNLQKKQLILASEKKSNSIMSKACNLCSHSMKLNFSANKQNAVPVVNNPIRRQILTRIFSD